MPKMDYEKTIIYKIQHKENDELLYIGHTTNFAKRKVRHKSNCYNANGSHYNLKLYQTIRDNDGWDAFSMVIIKEFPCENKRQAEAEEDKVMRETKSSLNMVRAYTTEEEKKEYQKEYDKIYNERNKDKKKEQKHTYYMNNIDKTKNYLKDYYRQNKEKILERSKESQQRNREHRKEYQQEYRQKNIDILKDKNKEKYEKNKEKLKEKVLCECGCTITKGHLTKHKRSIKHQAFINQQTDQ